MAMATGGLCPQNAQVLLVLMASYCPTISVFLSHSGQGAHDLLSPLDLVSACTSSCTKQVEQEAW